jgi:hypothetical protein
LIDICIEHSCLFLKNALDCKNVSLYNDFFAIRQGLIIFAGEMSKPTPIRTLLASLIAAKGWEGRVELHKVFDFWDELLGADIARQAQPHVIRKTVLWVRVSDAVWMQQLHLLKEMILEKLNSRLKNNKLTDLRFQLDSSLGRDEGDEAGRHAARPAHFPSAERRDEFESLLESINDNEMKAAIRKCWLKTGHLRDTREQDGR